MMESKSETLTVNTWSRSLQHVVSPLLPSLLVAVSYVDPGKFAAAVEGGSRFGSDLVWPVLFLIAAAILCQYLSACVAIATGKDLAQICSEEYDKITCVFLGVQAELSMILLDLTMVLGAAHGLNAVFGVDLFTCVFLTMMGAFLFPFLATVHEYGKAAIVCICLASAVLLSYFLGVLMGQPDTSFSFGFVTKLGGESAFVLMGLLGASIMPHNFYLHSSIIQRQQETKDLSKEAACHQHFLVIACIFSCIFLVNYALMNLAANVFYSAGLVLLTFQDALSLLDQVYRSSLVPFALVLILLFSNQIMAITWNYARRMVIYEFFGIDIPVWLHQATIRIIVIVPALCSVWNAGAEGMYQLLVFSQVLVALLIPSSVIPLFRIASSRAIMGSCQISQILEFKSLVIFICMMGLKVTFVIEMIFGNSDWASNLRWSMGNIVPVPYVTLLVIASGSFCFMLWLAATPLKSASFKSNASAWDILTPLPDPLALQYQNDFNESTYIEKAMQMQEPVAVMEKSMDDSLPKLSLSIRDVKLPESLMETENILHRASVEENISDLSFSGSCMSHPEVATLGEKVLGGAACSDVPDGASQDTSDQKSKPQKFSVRPSRIEGDSLNEKDDGDSWEPEEANKGVPESSLSLTSDGPASYRSLSGKGDDIGSGTGSLSRLAGLGRAARRQLTVILDEFWGQLFDLHGQPTQEGRSKKLDVLLGIDSRVDAKFSPASVKSESRKDLSGYISSSGGRDSDSLSNTSLYNSSKQQGAPGCVDPLYGAQRVSSSMRSTHVQLLDAYVRNSGHNTFDAGERRYSSMHTPVTSVGYDQQPATIHGYELASYLNQIAKERGSSYLNGQMDPLAPKLTSSVISSYGNSVSRSLAPKPQSGLSTMTPPGFHNVSVPRNSSSQTQRTYYDLSSPKNLETTGSSVNVKKYCSLPDISGLHLPHGDPQNPGMSTQWDKSMKSFHSVSRSAFDQNFSSTPLRTAVPAGFGEHSPKVCRDAFSLQFSSGSGSGSLWSRQPFEQFGVAEKSSAANDERIEPTQRSNNEEKLSAVDAQGKLVQLFRYCILRLLKLEGSDWLFKQNDGVDEDLIDRVAARERFHYEAETNPMNRLSNADLQFLNERKSLTSLKSDELEYAKSSISLSPYCGEGCVYRADLIVSFAVWCIHRILELSLMESRPELWGKYTYVLNRLQGMIDLAFYKLRPPLSPCFCLDIPAEWQQRPNTGAANGSLPPTAKIGKGKYTTGAMMLELVKDVEIAISCRKGRSGTAAGEVAFPKGKENLASVLKRYKRRLSSSSSKPVVGSGSQESGSSSPGQRRVASMLYGL